MPKAVCLVGTTGDDHTEVLEQRLSALGARVVRLETDRIPEQVPFSWDDGRVSYGGQRLDDIQVFYVKGIAFSLPPPDARWGGRNFPSYPERYLAQRERHSLIASGLRSLEAEGRLFVNSLASFELNQLKAHQIALLRKQEIPTPATLATSDPAAVREFAKRHPRIIYKPLGAGAMASRLDAADLSAERLDLLLNCPVLFQEEIQGDEFRAYLVDGQPVAAFHIPTEGVVDARVALDRRKSTELPAEVWEMCARAARGLGLVWTAVDMRRTAEGRFVVLECNPTPAVSFFEDLRTSKILTHLAEYLLGKA